MVDDISADPVLLDEVAGSMSDLRTRARNIHDTLTGSLQSLGQPWGNDSTGRSFYTGAGGSPGYGPSSNNLFTALANTATTFGQFAAGQAAAATAIAHNEHNASDAFDNG
jgi:hypothetical protein